MGEIILEGILKKCKLEEDITDEEIAYLLSRDTEAECESIFAAAREKREQYFGNKIFLYSFVYFSNYCQNNCTFCYFRRDNEKPARYRKTLEEVVQTACELKESGVHLIDLTTGDDPYYTNHPERLADIIRAVKEKTQLPVMVSPGLLNEKGLELIKDADVDWYALYHETHRKSLFETLRIEQSYEARMDAKRYAAKLGILIEEGLLVGVEDSIQDRVESFHNMKELGASQVRVMTFIPQDGAPLEGEHLEDFNRELMTIAVMRLLFPQVLIPASLDVDGLQGLYSRLMAGANVVTSIIPPKEGYAGVAKSSQDIDEGYRTVAGIQSTLQKCNLVGATAQEYQDWIAERKRI